MRGAFGDEICTTCEVKNHDMCQPGGYFRPTSGKTYLVDPPVVASRCTHPRRGEVRTAGVAVYATIIPFFDEIYRKYAGSH